MLDTINSVVNVNHFTSFNISAVNLLKSVIENKARYLCNIEAEGYITPKQDFSLFFDEIKNLGGRLIYKQTSNENTSEYKIFTWENGIADLSSCNNYLNFHAFSTNEESLVKLKSIVDSFILPAIRKGQIFSIVRSGPGLSFTSLGDAGVPLIKDNYDQSVISNYDFAVDDLNSYSPSGRIVILEGEPGTGKTHIIRSFLNDVPNGMFVLVSPEILTELSGPELLPLLLSHKEMYSQKGPIILVLEDADKCLVSRASDNINSIQALLNLGDGILGSMLDLRIIATTNAKKLDLEPAILRPGRLSKRIEVGKLGHDKAKNILDKLIPETSFVLDGNTFTLAEVYSIARKYGWKSVKTNDK